MQISMKNRVDESEKRSDVILLSQPCIRQLLNSFQTAIL
jgi:hypothetical protein